MIGELYPGEFEAMEHNGRMDALEQEQGMTREEAIAILIREVEDDPFMRTEYREHIHEALNIAIKALEHPEENVVAIVPCGDAISRQAVLDAIGRVGMCKCSTNEIEAVSECTRAVKALPLVTAEPKTGRWIKISPAGIYECSECGQNVMTSDICAYKFCHGCGAKMVEPQESEVQE